MAGVEQVPDPPDKPPDTGGEREEAMEQTVTLDETESGEQLDTNNSQVENPDRALVPVGKTFAEAASERQTPMVVDILRIVLKKTEKSASYYLKHKEKARLIFRELGIERKHVEGIEQEDFRTIKVHLNVPADGYKIAHSIHVKDGLVTLPMRMFRRLTKVKVHRVGLLCPEEDIREMLSHFGTVEEPITWSTYYDDSKELHKLSEDEKLMLGIKSGDIETKMFIHKHIPSFGLLPNGRKVRIRYMSQPVTCARCHQGIRGCRGNANAARCEKAGGKSVPLADFWQILTSGSNSFENGEEDVIPGNTLLVEGLGKDAGVAWVRDFLGVCIQSVIEETQITRSEDKLSWEITGLSPEEIRKTLEAVSGTQFKGRTTYCTPVVTSNPLFKPVSPSSETEETQEEESEKTDGDSGEKEKEKNDDDKGNDDDDGGFKQVESKSAEKKKKREEKKRKEEAEKLAEDAYAQKTGLTPPKVKGKKAGAKKTSSKRTPADADLSSPEQSKSKTRHSSRTRQKVQPQAQPPPNPTLAPPPSSPSK